MIPYEELSAALERFAARRRGDAPAPHHEAAHEHAHHEAHGGHEHHAPPTAEHDLPPAPDAHAHGHAPLGGDDEHTTVGDMQPVGEDRSNEIELGDVITDEENPT